MSSNELPCPIWGSPPSPQGIGHGSLLCDYPRAGGRFILDYHGAVELNMRPLTPRQKANLSYWIYHHNLRYRLFDESPGQGEDPVVLDQEWVEGNRDRTPLSSDRVLTYLREVIRNDDAPKQPDGNGQLAQALRMAAGGCRHDNDWDELCKYAAKKGWLGSSISGSVHPGTISLSGRIHVEEQLRDLGRGRQAFVAMWFDPCMKKAYSRGIKPAIRDVGYEPVRIDRKEFLGKVDDEIVAELRKSRFVVADFTTSKKSGARGGVYYEAGFASGLGIDVIYTCRKDRMKAVHFDTNHFNHITWKKPKDLREQLRNRIAATLGRGPLDPSSEQSGRADDALNEDS